MRSVLGSLALSASVATGAFIAVCFGAADARAATSEQAASDVAHQVTQGLKKAGLSLEGVVIAPFTGAEAAAFEGALTKALVDEKGVKLIDRSSFKAAVDEAKLAGDMDQAMTELAGGLGASVLITGSVTAVGDEMRVNVKAIQTSVGTVIAAAQASFQGAEGGGAVGAPSLQGQLRRLADRLAAGLDRIDGEVRYQRFAVLPFEEVGEATQTNQLGTLIAAELTTLLQRDHDLLVVERSQIKSIIDEMALGQTGLVDESKSAEIGKLAGAEALVMGSVSAAGAEYLVNAKVVSTRTGQVVLAEQSTLPAADLVALSSDAVVLRSSMGAVFRSAVIPGWGQFYNRQPVKAGIVIGLEAVAVGMAVTFHLLGEDRVSYYNSLGAGTPESEFAAARSDAKDYYQVRDGMLIAVAGVYLLNLADAFLSGTDAQSVSGSLSSGSVSLPW